MKPTTKARLERAGWMVGDTAWFLKLSPAEARFAELKLALAKGVRQLRERRGLTQSALAEQMGSSQSRVAKMEAAAGRIGELLANLVPCLRGLCAFEELAHNGLAPARRTGELLAGDAPGA